MSETSVNKMFKTAKHTLKSKISAIKGSRGLEQGALSDNRAWFFWTNPYGTLNEVR